MSEPKTTYYLDLQTLLTYLRNKSGTLTASLSIAGQHCKGFVSLSRGQATACRVECSNGRFYEGKDAFDRLQAIQEWQVHFDNQPPPSVTLSRPGTRPEPVTPKIPRPKGPLAPHLLTGYSPQQRIVLRSVHFMIDGHKTVDQIKAQLNLPPETVDSALATLLRLAVIEY